MVKPTSLAPDVPFGRARLWYVAAFKEGMKPRIAPSTKPIEPGKIVACESFLLQSIYTIAKTTRVAHGIVAGLEDEL